MDPDKYWLMTLRELDYAGSAFNTQIKLFSMIEFAVYDTQYSHMSGKKIFNQAFLRSRFPILFENEPKQDLFASVDKMIETGLVKKK